MSEGESVHCTGLFQPGSSVCGILQERILEWIAILFSRGSSPHPGIKPGSSALQADSLPSEPPEKPSHYGDQGSVELES